MIWGYPYFWKHPFQAVISKAPTTLKFTQIHINKRPRKTHKKHTHTQNTTKETHPARWAPPSYKQGPITPLIGVYNPNYSFIFGAPCHSIHNLLGYDGGPTGPPFTGCHPGVRPITAEEGRTTFPELNVFPTLEGQNDVSTPET